LRKNDISAEVYPEITKKIGKQFEYANKLQINFACIIGETELNSNTLQVKNLESGEQQPMEIETLIKLLQS
jgi:histidyl-tRNA synthetase